MCKFQNRFQCQICLQDTLNLKIISIKCGHLMCLDCYIVLKNNNNPCPFCRSLLSVPSVLRNKYFCSRCRTNFLNKEEKHIIQLLCGHAYCDSCLYEKRPFKMCYYKKCSDFKCTRKIFFN